MTRRLSILAFTIALVMRATWNRRSIWAQIDVDAEQATAELERAIRRQALDHAVIGEMTNLRVEDGHLLADVAVEAWASADAPTILDDVRRAQVQMLGQKPARTPGYCSPNRNERLQIAYANRLHLDEDAWLERAELVDEVLDDIALLPETPER